MTQHIQKYTPNQTDAESVSITAMPHPFRLERTDHYLPAGLTLTEILTAVQADPVLWRYAHIFINGEHIPRNWWPHVRPKAHAQVSIRMVPQGGGGGKNPLRTVLSVAMLAVTPQLGALFGSTLGAQFGGIFSMSLTQKVLTGGLNFLGRLAMNAIAPPAEMRRPKYAKESRTQFIQGARNSAQPFENIPQVLGTHRLVPPLAARPYTETMGDAQYVRMLFAWGYGPLEIRDLKIGETPLEDFEEVEVETLTGNEDMPEVSLYPGVVLQNDLNVKLTRSAGHILRTTEKDVEEISVDITFPNGMVEFKDSGKRTARTVHVEVQYAPAGTNDWSAGAQAYSQIAAQTIPQHDVPGLQRHYIDTSMDAYRFKMRIDSVVIDRASGLGKVIKGTAAGEYNETRQPYNDDITARPPFVPTGKIEIARLVYFGNEEFPTVVDRRPHSNIKFESAHDFRVTVHEEGIKIDAGSLRFDGFDVRAQQTTALRKTLRFAVPRGQYDVRLRRLTADNDDPNTFDNVFWTALRSIRGGRPVRLQGMALTALRIKATDQLNGTIDQFNGVVSAVIPDWDGEEWRPQATANPASICRYILQGPANARPLPDDRLDIDGLQEWHRVCANEKREFNAVIDPGQSVMDVMNAVTVAGRAAPSLIDGRWGVVRDTLKTVPVQHFTPRNSYNFEAERAFDDHPHGLRVKFNNRKAGWQLDERIIYDDGYDENNATKFEGLELTGITDPEQIWRDGRYHIASARLRPESFSFCTDLEHIVCTRGDLVRLTHDAALIGLASARIKEVLHDDNNLAIGAVLDTDIEMVAGVDYVLRVRGQTGESTIIPLIGGTVTDTTVYFNDALAADAPVAAGDLCMFGEAGRESVELIVKTIEPQDNMTAKITCVNAAPEVHESDKGEIPPFDSMLTIPQALTRPDRPVVSAMQSGAEVLKPNTDGSFSPQVVFTMQAPESLKNMSLSVYIREKDENVYRPVTVQSIGAHQYAIGDVIEGRIYDMSLRYIRNGNIASASCLITGYTVIGAAEPPDKVTDFTVNTLGDTVHLSWRAVDDIDLSHYKIKFSADTDHMPEWNAALDLIEAVPKTATGITAPALKGYYMIKAVDLGGRESPAAAIIQTDIPRLADINVVETLRPDLRAGYKNNVVAVDGTLRFSGADTWQDWDNLDTVENIDIGENGYAQQGTFYFPAPVDLQAVYTSRVTAKMRIGGLDLNRTVDQRENVDFIENWDNIINPEKWNVHLMVRTTRHDPADPHAEWTEWSRFVIGDLNARGIDFKLALESREHGVTPVVTDVEITVDMPDRTASGQDIIAPGTGTDIMFDPPFAAKPVLAIAGQNLAPGDRHIITNLTPSGFTIHFYNDENVAVSRTFDYLAKGYGRQG